MTLSRSSLNHFVVQEKLLARPLDPVQAAEPSYSARGHSSRTRELAARSPTSVLLPFPELGEEIGLPVYFAVSWLETAFLRLLS